MFSIGSPNLSLPLHILNSSCTLHVQYSLFRFIVQILPYRYFYLFINSAFFGWNHDSWRKVVKLLFSMKYLSKPNVPFSANKLVHTVQKDQRSHWLPAEFSQELLTLLEEIQMDKLNIDYDFVVNLIAVEWNPKCMEEKWWAQSQNWTDF